MFDAWFIARALGLGSAIGFSLGALGAGGSILTVPILVYAMGLPVHGAAGTSLAIVGLNAATGALDYIRRGRALPRTALAFGASGLAATLGGVWLNHQLRGEVILVLFSVLMMGAAVSMLRQRVRGTLTTVFQERYGLIGWVRLVTAGLVVGVLTGFFGIGGGFLIVPALILVIGVPMQLAVGTSLLIIALNALWGLIGYLQLGGLDWAVTLPFAIGGGAGVLVGGKLAGVLPERMLRTAFAVLIVGLGVYTFIRSTMTLAAS